MELIKKLLDLLTSFFQSKKETTKQENIAKEQQDNYVTEKIRASENAKAIEATAEANKTVEEVKHQQDIKNTQLKEDIASGKKTQEEADDDQFGGSW